ncbi:HAD family hydrolase [Corynebacterium lubricantis]|uniref:HAD family hydrolase n=1 Tax=Corynebacterium lubricantis TaxID=541095 RepID=UPI00035DB0CF|nr:HAD family hydrolase [Corynebacterium lubricantis]
MKLAAFDFDGTILFDQGISPTDLQAIHQWQAAGHLAVAATGKSKSAAQEALAGIDISFDYSVLFTGAVVTDAQGTALRTSTIDAAVVQEIVVKLSSVEGIAVYGTRLNERDSRFSDTIGDKLETNILRGFEEMSVDDIAGQEFIGVPIWVPGNPGLQAEIRDWIAATYPVECVLNQTFVDVIPQGSTKGAGLEWLGNHLGVSREDVEVFTFGDSWNDMSMHEIADTSFAFPWSPDGVKAATDHVVESTADGLRLVADL